MWSWMRIARRATEAENPEAGAPAEEIPIQLSFHVGRMFLCLCAVTAFCMVLAMGSGHVPKAEPSGLGVSQDGSLCLCGMGWHACWMSGVHSCEYGDALKTGKRLEEILQSLGLCDKSRDCR